MKLIQFTTPQSLCDSISPLLLIGVGEADEGIARGAFLASVPPKSSPSRGGGS